ncbi:TRBV25-1 isoform 1 [Pongo abelii]|uniref:TRBV25-1 isoform 1 n=1 Tax=Pongo abelii TaxID=9601 RepID=A0A2J8T0T6_PONAB|nr:TRBV25-1 isoform 1 [Pongo abelii]
MTIRLLCQVAFYFLGAGLMEADIYQTPRHCVIRTGKKITLECSQTMGHDKMYWSRSRNGITPHPLFLWVNSTEKGDLSFESTVSRIRIERFPLTLESASPSHTSQYLCASSEYTVLHGYRHSAQKGSPLR